MYGHHAYFGVCSVQYRTHGLNVMFLPYKKWEGEQVFTPSNMAALRSANLPLQSIETEKTRDT